MDILYLYEDSISRDLGRVTIFSSLDRFQDDETKSAESTDAESAPVMTKDSEQQNIVEKPTTPGKDSKEKEGRKGILNAIRLPLVSSVFPRKKKASVRERFYPILFSKIFEKENFITIFASLNSSWKFSIISRERDSIHICIAVAQQKITTGSKKIISSISERNLST